MNPDRIEIQWTRRRAPLPPVAAVARDGAARKLVTRLLEREDEVFARLRGVASDDLVLVLGDRDDLPWVDGVSYLGRAPGAPELLVPTNLEPTVPESLLSRAISHAQIAPPVGVLVDKKTLVSFQDARPLDRGALKRWLDQGAIE